MKQRIRVVGIIETSEGALFLRRSGGRDIGGVTEEARYELPTGKILFGEQPEEAMSRVLYETTGLHSKSIQLKDAITFTYLTGASRLGNLYIIYSIEVEQGVVKITGEKYNGYKYVKNTETGLVRIDEASLSVMEILSEKRGERVAYREVANSATVFVDGGSRGNPGPAGIGYYIVGVNGEVLKRGGEFIGFNSSRIAEYFAVKEGLEQARDLGLQSIRIVSDSLMVVNQMNGVIKVKNRDLIAIYNDIQKLLRGFENFAFIHVTRDQNTDADAEANLAMDRYEEGEEG